MSQFDLRHLRSAFGTFLTGVTVVTTREKSGIPRGFTANSFTSVSLDPPMLLICIDKSAESLDVFSESDGFAINILAEDQAETSGLFASKRVDKFDSAKWIESESGYPLLEGVSAWFDCQRHQVVDAGDHVILIGQVSSYDFNDRIGLGYVRGGYMSLSLERSAAKTAGVGSSAIVGAIIEIDGKIWLEKNSETGKLHVPASGLDHTPGSLNRFQAYLLEKSITASISSLFAVFENEESGQQSIYYRARGEFSNEKFQNPGEVELFEYDDIPWGEIDSNALVVMLKRYVTESRRQRFGVYFGSDRDGSVKTLSENQEDHLNSSPTI